MIYQYRNIRVEFEAPDQRECSYRIYCYVDSDAVCVDFGKVSVGKEVANLSDCALKEFARKYIDVNFSRLCTNFNPGVALIRPPLSISTLAVAVRIQNAANKEVRRIAQSTDDTVTLTYSKLKERLKSDVFSVRDFRDIILEGVEKLSGFQSCHLDKNEMILKINRQQDEGIVQSQPQMTM